MDANEELRLKRLNFYNKFIIKNDQSNELKNQPSNLKPTYEMQQKSLKDSQTPDQLLNEIFNSNPSPKKLTQSISFPNGSINQTNNNQNSKLEEFKKIVESSYLKHVLNKSELSNSNNQSLSRRLSTQSASSYQAWNQNWTSFDESQKNSSRNFGPNQSTDSLISFINEQQQTNQIDPNPPIAIKIPYMSAYNIYDQNLVAKDQRVDSGINTVETSPDLAVNEDKIIMEKYFDSLKLDENNRNEIKNNLKKLTSNGSSLNTSPTSISSSGSIKNIPTPREAKPPETPKTKSTGLTFRRNLIKLNTTSVNFQSKNETDNNLNPNQTTPTLDKNQLTKSLDIKIKNETINNNNNNNNNINYANKNTYDILENTFIRTSSGLVSKNNRLEPINKSIEKEKELKNATLENFFDPKQNKKINNKKQNTKKSKSKKSNKNKTNIFNYLNDFYNGENDNFNFINDDSDNEDTLGIFSSQDSNSDSDIDLNVQQQQQQQKQKQSQKTINKFDLTIDLGQLNTSDDDDYEIINNINNDNKIAIEAESQTDDPTDNQINKLTSRNSGVQVKPDIIPNLALDLMDDDRSISVAVSLAKSLCKEIDYKQEMEMIEQTLKKEDKTLQKQDKEQKQNTNSHETINLSPLKITYNLKPNNQFNFENENMISINKKSTFNNNTTTNNYTQKQDTYFLKPPLSSRQSSARHVKVTNFTRSKTSLGNKSNDVLVDSLDTSIHEIVELPKPNKAKTNLQTKLNVSSENLLLNSIDAFQLKSKLKLNNISSQTDINENDINNQRPNSKNRRWQTSMNVSYKRPDSASKNINKNNNKNSHLKSNSNLANKNQLQNISRPPSADSTKPSLFLSYSKLVAIEANLQREALNSNQINQNPILSSVDLKFDLPTIETYSDNKEIINQNSKIEKEKLEDETELKNEAEQLQEPQNDQNEDVKVDWSKLPHEIWLNILSLLKQSDLVNFGQTCKIFNKLYLDNSLWRSIEIKYKYNMTDNWLDWVGKRRPNELNIVQCSGNITLNGISEMFKNIGENLTKLNLSRCSNGSLSGDNFALQASIRCPNVTCLDLSWTLLSNQTLKLIVDSFKKIESINLSGCNMIKEDGFNQLLLRHGEYMTDLELSGCIHFSSSIILNIGAYCRNLERLNISNCHRMTNEAIMEACPQWLKIKFIDLRGIKNIKNNCISTLVRRCAHLEGLALGECVHIGDSSILEIATYKPNIKYLDVNNCKKISDNSIRSIANFCCKLEFLNIKGTSISDIGLITLSNGKFIKTLEDLNLSFLPISENVLLKLLINAERLKKIHLYGCYNIKHLEDIKTSIGFYENKTTSLEINI